MTDQNPSSNDPKKDPGKRPRKRKQLPDDGFDWWKATRTLTIWTLLVIVTWILFRQLNLEEKPEVHRSYTQYQKLLESGQIDGAEIIEREFHGRLKDGGSIVTVLPYIDGDMLAAWDSLKIDYQFKEKSTSWFGIFLINFLPWIIILAFWLYLMRRMQGGGGARGVFSFGKSRAKLSMEGKPKVTFEDVAGCDEAKVELQEVIAFLRDPKKFTKLGGRIPKGALLLGPPGTGKTLLARAVAGEAEVPFFSMSGADFVEMFVGVGAARVRDLFETGKKHAPCIIFIDEIDAVGRHRGAGLGGGHDEREQTLNQLLVEMDGFEGNDGVILIAATNRPDVLDPALTRPGRFDRQIVVDRPDVRGREGILKVHTRQIPLGGDVKLEVLAKGTPGLAGAELANLVNEAALLAARRNASQVSMTDLEEAKDKVMMGTERKSLLISEEEKRQTAYHEAGHVLVAKMTPGADPVHKVTIIPRGRALGLTHYLPLDEKHNYSRNYLRQTLTHLMGGRVAEKIVFSEFSTGAGNDIERATDIARRMVCEWGMSDRFGPISFGKRHEEIFLGREISQHRDFSERTAQDIDSEIRKIVSDAEQNAERLIRGNLDKLKLIAEALLEREILDGEEIDILLRGGRLPPLARISDVQVLKQAQSLRGGDYNRRDRDRGDRGDRGGQGQRQSQRSDQQRGQGDRWGRARGDQPRGEQPRSEQPRGEQPRVDQPKPEQQRVENREAQPQGRQDSRPEQPRGERSRPSEGGRNNPARSRREFARTYGVVSSRDPENRRPTPSEIGKMRQQQLARGGQQPQPTLPTPPDRVTPPVEPKQTPSEAPVVETRPQTPEHHYYATDREVRIESPERRPDSSEPASESRYSHVYNEASYRPVSVISPDEPPAENPLKADPSAETETPASGDTADKPQGETRRQGRFRSYRSRERRPRRDATGEGGTASTPPAVEPDGGNAAPEPTPAPQTGGDDGEGGERNASRRRSRPRRPRPARKPKDGGEAGEGAAPLKNDGSRAADLFNTRDRGDGD